MPLPTQLGGRRRRGSVVAAVVLLALLISSLAPLTVYAYALGDRLLIYGSRGQDVAQLQTLLTQAGYAPGVPDGIFGRQTFSAVTAFQSDYGLKVDGVVGPQTIRTLRAAVAPPAPPALPAPPPVPAPVPTPTPPAQPGRLLVMGYYDQNWSGDQDAWNSLSAHAGQMDFVSPFWFSVHADGSVYNRGWNWSQVQQTSHTAGARVLALFNNAGGDDAVLQSPATRQAAAANIAAGVSQNRLDGAVLDFESLPASDRSQLTALVKDLAARLHAQGKLLAVAVGPKWNADDSYNDGAAVYDYVAIGQAADYVQIMTYDQHTVVGSAGPVAALSWVDSVAAFAITQIPASKILLGVAAYGYEWPASDQWGVVYAKDAAGVAASHGVGITWDDAAQEPHFTYKDRNGVSRTVWFENSYSVAPKLQVAQKYGLAGVALWRLGQEDSRMWSVLPAGQ